MQNQPLVQKRKIQRLALPKAPSLNQNLLESLFNQRNQCSRRDWFKKHTPHQEPTDPDWNIGKTTQEGPTQNWLMTQAASTSTDKSLKDFDELMSTPIDFSGYILNGLKIENLTQEILLGPAFRLLKGTRSNYAELEYDFEECYKALSKKLDWKIPEGSNYPFDLSKPIGDTVMSDFEDSTVTYTAVSSPFGGLLDIGSPGVVGPENKGLPWMLDDPYVQVALQAPPSPDYIHGPEEPHSPPPPDFVPEPVYSEFMPLEDEILPAEEQPQPTADSPTANSPGYIPESDPEEDPEEDDNEDPEEDPANYPADEGDDGNDEDEPSDDDEDDGVDIEADDEEEEEHPAPVDSTTVALPAIDHAPSVEETEPFETGEFATIPPPHPAYRVTARISIPAPVPTPVWSDAEVARLLAISTPPSSPLSPWSSPLPQIPFPSLNPIPSPSLPLLPPLPVSAPPPASPIHPLGYQAAMIRMRVKAASTSHSLPLPLPIILSHTRPNAPSSGTPPLHLLSTDCRTDRPEVTLPPWKRLGITLGPRNEVQGSSSATARPTGGLRADYGFFATMDREISHDIERDVGYGITDSWDEIVEAMQGTPVDTNEVYTRLDDEQTERQLLAGRLNMLFRDRHAHARTTRLIEAKARMSREAWGRSMDASDLTRAEVMSLCTTLLAQQSMITELQAADHKRHAVITEMLAADGRRQKQFIETLKLLKRLQT
ncbi:hypothetical protein Tco_0621993 [Tanacetum coccineum]